MKYLIGIQPTGRIHLGNYLGCLARGLRLQDDGHDVTFMIANYHSLTTDSYTDITEKELRRLGCGKVTKQTPEYTELFFKLCCRLNLGTLLKMPQYKDKKEAVEYDLGLLLYPVLMAADIIINDPDVVIIGRDQVAHMELANDVSRRMGLYATGYEYKVGYRYEFGDFEKVASLKDPSVKMSKSAGEKHVLYLFDEDYRGKLKGANMDEQGTANLSRIGSFFGVEYRGQNAEFKDALADRIEETFSKKTAILSS